MSLTKLITSMIDGSTRSQAEQFIFKRSFGNMELIAHRGFRNQFPQNTMMAFSSALEAKADSLECDVQISSDGVAYVFHDATVDSLTNGSGPISSLTSSTINGLTLNLTAGTIFSDEKIPTFTDFLAFAKEQNVYVYPEIKQYRTQADITIMVNAVVAAKMEDLCLLQSFNFSDLEYVRNLNSKIAIGYLGSANSGYETYVDQLRILGNGSLLWAYWQLVATPAIIAYCRLNGVDVGAYTVNTETDALNVINAGCTKIMSDITLGGR
tara:strand:- start:746 stop:1546 length:801 start_codon:yes stop_codon:yes gene_type:complete